MDQLPPLPLPSVFRLPPGGGQPCRSHGHLGPLRWRLGKGRERPGWRRHCHLDGDTALFTAGAGDRDKTVSCSRLVSKRKNFVSRGADHSAALRVPFRLGSRKLARPVPPASASLRAARGALLDCRAARNRRSAANRDGFRRTGTQGAGRRSFNRGLPIPCRHADLRGLGRPANRIVWASRRNGTPRRDRYCFTKTKVEVNSLPSPFVPLVLVVIVLPSFETTMRLVA